MTGDEFLQATVELPRSSAFLYGDTTVRARRIGTKWRAYLVETIQGYSPQHGGQILHVRWRMIRSGGDLVTIEGWPKTSSPVLRLDAAVLAALQSGDVDSD